MNRLNLGCGYNKLPGYVNVDLDVNCKPDVVTDLEQILPFDDNSIDEIYMYHVLEHLGQDTKTYFRIWKELYRICKDQALLRITVPHWQHENFHHDPTHVRKITPIGIDMFSQKRNMHTIKTGGSETTLGLQLGIDVSVVQVGYDLSPWFEAEMNGNNKLTIEHELKKMNNTCFQVTIHAQVHKPTRYS